MAQTPLTPRGRALLERDADMIDLDMDRMIRRIDLAADIYDLEDFRIVARKIEGVRGRIRKHMSATDREATNAD